MELVLLRFIDFSHPRVLLLLVCSMRYFIRIRVRIDSKFHLNAKQNLYTEAILLKL